MLTGRPTMFAAVVAGLLAGIATTVQAEEADFCGSPLGEPAALQAAVEKLPGVKELLKNEEYVAYQDPATEAVYTFTQAKQNAHPAAVCRKPVKEGDVLTVKMKIVCKGNETACGTLTNDFNLMNARMQNEVNEKIGTGK